MDYEKWRRRCFDKLVGDIRRGRYKADEKLPSDFIVSRDFSLSRLDVRNIYRNLESMDYVYAVRGVGRFLKKDVIQIPMALNDGRSFTEKMEKTKLPIGTLNKDCELIFYDEKINSKFFSKTNAVYKVTRIRYFENTPIACHISYLRQDIFSEVELEEIEKIDEYYKRFGIFNIEEQNVEFSIEYANEEVRNLLDCGELTLIVREEHMVIDLDRGIPIEFTRVFYIGDRFKFKL